MLSHNEVFKKYGVNTRSVTDRLVKIYGSATPDQIREGFGWYPAAERHAEIMAEKAGSKKKAAAVISHLSPRLKWEKNLEAAYDVVNGRTPKGIIGRSLKNAKAALEVPDPIITFNGPKTKAFYQNIIGDRDRVTIDVHAARAAFGREVSLNASLYSATEYAYTLASKRVGVSPRDFQAVIWNVVR